MVNLTILREDNDYLPCQVNSTMLRQGWDIREAVENQPQPRSAKTISRRKFFRRFDFAAPHAGEGAAWVGGRGVGGGRGETGC